MSLVDLFQLEQSLPVLLVLGLFGVGAVVFVVGCERLVRSLLGSRLCVSALGLVDFASLPFEFVFGVFDSEGNLLHDFFVFEVLGFDGVFLLAESFEFV